MYCEHTKEHKNTVEKAKNETLSVENLEKICRVFHLLSEPKRMKIVLALMQGEMCVYHLLEVCEGTLSGLSHQLRILRDNKIVKARRLGKNIEYSIADEHVREIVEMGIRHLDCKIEN